MDALVFGSDPLDAVTLRVSSPHKELRIFKETMVPMEDTGSSVDPLKGEYIRSKTDLAVKFPGGRIKVRRLYVGNRWRLEPSRTNMLDPMAPQLDFETSGGEIENIVRNRAVYEKKADGLWIHRDVYSIVETPGGYRWEDKVGRYEEYDERDNLTKVVHPDCASVEYEYDLRFNKPTRIADERGVEYEFEYDGSGNLAPKT